MNELLHIWQRPGEPLDMIAGWRQWADAGDVSSGLPRYLIEQTRAARIGRIDPGEFYLFQLPGTHHLLRPIVKLAEGHRVDLNRSTNEFFLASAGDKEVILFLGTEPHRDEARYATAFFDAVETLGIRTVACLAGVHGPVPHWRDRRVSCVYSSPLLKTRLARLGVRFSGYEGGATIAMYLASKAGERSVELARLCAYVPTYDFSAEPSMVRRMAMDEDYRAWHGLTRRLNGLLGLSLDLSDLASRSEALTAAWNDQIQELATTLPRLQVREYLAHIVKEFDQESPGGGEDLWESALRDIVDGGE